MAEEQRTERTRAERLDAVLQRLASEDHAYMKAHGAWRLRDGTEEAREAPPDASVQDRKRRIQASFTTMAPDARAKALPEPAAPGEAEDARLDRMARQQDAARRQAPYEIRTDGDRTRIIVTGADGDVVSGAGKDIGEALAALEAKAGGGAPADSEKGGKP